MAEKKDAQLKKPRAKPKQREIHNKKVACAFTDLEYGQMLATFQSENIKLPSKVIKFFIDSYMEMDKDARAVVENYKQKNKIVGRIKKPYILKQEKLAIKSETLYNLNDDDIEDIYDVLDQTLED